MRFHDKQSSCSNSWFYSTGAKFHIDNCQLHAKGLTWFLVSCSFSKPYAAMFLAKTRTVSTQRWTVHIYHRREATLGCFLVQWRGPLDWKQRTRILLQWEVFAFILYLYTKSELHLDEKVSFFDKANEWCNILFVLYDMKTYQRCLEKLRSPTEKERNKKKLKYPIYSGTIQAVLQEQII